MRLPVLLCCILAICISLTLSPAARSADDAAMLRESFEPARFVASEKRVLQTGLALLGHFRGPINGRWGVGSQQAFEDYAEAKFGDFPSNRMIASLMADFRREVGERDWRYEYLPEINISVAIPYSRLVGIVQTDETTDWEHDAGGLAVEFRRHPFRQLGGLHAGVVSDRKLVSEREELHEDDRWISRARHPNGENFYVYSRRAAGNWYSLLVNAPESDESLFNAVVASIRQGKVDAIPVLPELGLASRILKAASKYQ